MNDQAIHDALMAIETILRNTEGHLQDRTHEQLVSDLETTRRMLQGVKDLLIAQGNEA